MEKKKPKEGKVRRAGRSGKGLSWRERRDMWVGRGCDREEMGTQEKRRKKMKAKNKRS